MLLLDSQRGSELAKEYEEKGITVVYVPDDDPDHTKGTVYDDDQGETENGKE